jgi:hypothetical protein
MSCQITISSDTSHGAIFVSIGKADRNRVADAIERYLRCEIDNFQLDDILFKAEDRAAFEIAQEVWFFYDDCTRHKNEKRHKLHEAAEARLRRWVLFLKSDHEWPIDEPDSRNNFYSDNRWQGVARPIGCLLQLIVLPKILFDVLVRRYPRPRSANNEYWPFHSLEDWESFDSTGS